MRMPTNAQKALLAATACLAYGVSAQQAAAQVARYEPATPTVSPYLNLTLFNNGGLPNYYALVRPQIQQREFNQRARAFAQLQQREIVRLENEVTQGQEGTAVTGTGSWFLVPSQTTNYLNTRSYFPEPARPIRR